MKCNRNRVEYLILRYGTHSPFRGYRTATRRRMIFFTFITLIRFTPYAIAVQQNAFQMKQSMLCVRRVRLQQRFDSV